MRRPIQSVRQKAMPLVALVLAVTAASLSVAAERVFYAGGAGDEVFYDAVRLSDGRWLVAGRASALDWLPAGTPLTVAANTGAITSPNSTGTWIGFLLVLSPDLSIVEHCWHLPKGAAENIRRIRTTEVPGSPTGDLYLSGNIALTSWGDTQGGYFIAKLTGNFLAGPPSGLAWALNIGARGELKDDQPWDVGAAAGDTLLVAVSGSPHSADWMAADFYDGSGQPKALPALRAKTPTRLVLKTNSTGDFRSWTAADFTAITGDTNGGLRRGRWPMDAFYDGPYLLPGNGAGRGYTGYRNAGTAGHLSAVAVDRRSNAFYLGANIKTTLPDGNPDFEPWVSAYAADGAARWWTRLYSEWKDSATGPKANGLIDLDLDSNGDGVMDRSSEGLLSSPDQYVDGLALDHAGERLVVNARCHGNNVSNLWSGSSATIPGAPAGYTGFQRQFTGTSGNIHISWLGSFSLSDGTLRGATYVAGFGRGGPVNASASTDANLGGWPDANTGWANLNTTRIRPGRVAVDAAGRVFVIGTAPRLATTVTAWQRLLNPPATAPWHDFANVYSRDLSSLVYGTALCGEFTYVDGDTNTEPQGAEGVAVHGIVPGPGGFIALAGGTATGGAPLGNPLRTTDAPAWARSGRAASDAILARLTVPGGEPATPLAAWCLAHLGSATADLQADPDADGVPNLLEYALGGAPADGTSAPIPTLLVSGPGPQPLLTLTFLRLRSDLTYTVQVSADLANPAAWTDLAVNPGTIGETVTVIDTADVSTNPRRFLRLKVTAPP